MVKSETSQVIAIIKPDGVSSVFNDTPFQVIFEEKLQENKVRIIDVFSLSLDEDGLRKIFPVLNIPSDFGEERKQDFLRHMQTDKVEIYLLERSDANAVVTAIKKELRNTLLRDNSGYIYRVIKNLLHTSDVDDFEVTLKTIYEYKEKQHERG